MRRILVVFLLALSAPAAAQAPRAASREDLARIEAVLKKPRPIVRSVNFVGPDRRRQVKESGERRRAADRNG